MLIEFLFDLFDIAVFEWWDRRRARKRMRKAKAAMQAHDWAGKTPMSFRTLGGRVDGFGEGWNHGDAQVSTGKIVLTRYKGGFRFLPIGTTSLSVEEFSLRGTRDLLDAGLMWTDPEVLMYPLRTASAALEVALLPEIAELVAWKLSGEPPV